ncbi:YkvA family protein [Myxococcus stipitatus]|uniref:YkvA family protein n=1 Tax=Myxococcus stipitatus TaxID=83455 RepID=UPI003AF2CE5F
MQSLKRWRQKVQQLKTEVAALFIAIRHPGVPWYAKLLAAGVVAYALSPVDLIPDFIPVLGLLDDLVLVPLGILLVRRLIPPAVLAECRDRARAEENLRKTSWAAGAVIITLWVLLALLLVRWLRHP